VSSEVLSARQKQEQARDGFSALMMVYGIVVMLAGAVLGQGLMIVFQMLDWRIPAGVAALGSGGAILIGGVMFGFSWLRLRDKRRKGSAG
jgi:hypothetical protein